MKQYFVPYELSKELKEIGFDEPCLKLYTEEYKQLITAPSGATNSKVENSLPTKPFSAPLYDQVIDWLEDKHKLFLYTDRMPRAKNRMEYFYCIKSGDGFDTEPIFSGTFDDRKSAINRGIKKAIELIKQKK